MVKYLSLYLLIFFSISAGAQKNLPSTDSFSILGQIERAETIKISDLDHFDTYPIADLVITNHLGEIKGTAKNMKGIKIKDILASIKFKTDNPKLLSSFILSFVAADGYRVVYSWNEIFNSPTGDHLFLVTGKDGKSIGEMEERMLIVTHSDFKTGRRYIKGLSSIVVSKIE